MISKYDDIRKLSNTGNQENLNGELVKSIRLRIPPLPEQKAIADCLSTWDEAINKTSQLIAQKEQSKKWLMQNLLTGKKRLKGFSEKWEIYKLGNFIKESRIPSIYNDVNNRITVKLNLKGIEKREVRGSEIEEATSYFIRKGGQFIYGKQNLHKGAFGIIPKELHNYESSQDIPTFDFIGNIDPNFFFLYMSQENIYKSLEKISTGTGLSVSFLIKKNKPPLPKFYKQQIKKYNYLKTNLPSLKSKRKG